MSFILKVVLVVVIVFCAEMGKKLPFLSALIATMPLTTLIVMLWIYGDTGGDIIKVNSFVRGVIWGAVPTVLFYIVVYFCFQKRLPLPAVLAAGFSVWAVGALVHQALLK
jgi:uncharacterized membrane protein (GlpM family)